MALTKTALRKAVGRKAFTIPQASEALGKSVSATRAALLAAAEAGVVQVVGRANPQARTGERRGRPATLFQVAQGR